MESAASEFTLDAAIEALCYDYLEHEHAWAGLFHIGRPIVGCTRLGLWLSDNLTYVKEIRCCTAITHFLAIKYFLI